MQVSNLSAVRTSVKALSLFLRTYTCEVMTVKKEEVTTVSLYICDLVRKSADFFKRCSTAAHLLH